MHILQKILPLCESIEQLYWLESSFKQIRYCLWIAWPTLHQLAVPSSTLGYANWTRKIYSKIQRWISDETAWVVGCSLGWIHRCKYHSFKQKSKWIISYYFYLGLWKHEFMFGIACHHLFCLAQIRSSVNFFSLMPGNCKRTRCCTNETWLLSLSSLHFFQQFRLGKR